MLECWGGGVTFIQNVGTTQLMTQHHMQVVLNPQMYVCSIRNDTGTARIFQVPAMLWAVQDKADLRTGWDCVSGAAKSWCVLHSVWWGGIVVPWLRGSGLQVMATIGVICHFCITTQKCMLRNLEASSSQIVEYHTPVAGSGILRRKSRTLG